MRASGYTQLLWTIALILVVVLALFARNNTVLAQSGSDCTNASSSGSGRIGASCSGSTVVHQGGREAVVVVAAETAVVMCVW